MFLTPEKIGESLVLPFTDLTDELMWCWTPEETDGNVPTADDTANELFLLERQGFMPVGCWWLVALL